LLLSQTAPFWENVDLSNDSNLEFMLINAELCIIVK